MAAVLVFCEEITFRNSEKSAKRRRDEVRQRPLPALSGGAPISPLPSESTSAIMSKSSSSVGSWPMAATSGSTGEAQGHHLAQGGRAHCRVARSSHASMAPLLSLSKRAKASRHASISSLERDILT